MDCESVDFLELVSSHCCLPQFEIILIINEAKLYFLREISLLTYPVRTSRNDVAE